MIDNFYKNQPREILKRKMGADQLLKKIEKGFQKFIHSPLRKKIINLRSGEIHKNDFNYLGLY